MNDASLTDPSFARTSERWARFRFGVVGQLLAAPPAPGELQAQLRLLADQSWRHPVTGQPVRFGVSTIERWYYAARAARDPVQALARRPRSDQGTHPAISSQAAGWLSTQYREHPSWTYQLHADNLAVRLEADPASGPISSQVPTDALWSPPPIEDFCWASNSRSAKAASPWSPATRAPARAPPCASWPSAWPACAI